MSLENQEEVRLPVAQIASQGGDLKERVRQLVLDAILKRDLDPKGIRDVMKDTVEGLGEGLSGHAENAGQSLRTAFAGLDEALSKSIYALQMAVEETWDESKRFADADLRAAYDAVRHLEDDLVGTLKETASKSQGVVKDEFTKLSEHVGRVGSDTGAQAKDVLAVLGRDLGATASEAAKVARTDLGEAGDRLGAVASGLLRGLADALDSRKA